MSLTLVIGTKRYSSWSLRPWLALKVAGIPFQEVEIALRQPETKAEILKHSPSGKVPLLKDEGLAVWDSLAICEYLAERHPALWPAQPQARAVARSVAAEMHSGFMPLRRDCPMDVLADAPMAEIPDEVRTELIRLDSMWSDCRARFGVGGPFLFGAFSIADAMFAPVVWRFLTHAVELPAASQAWVESMLALPAMREWQAGALAEAE